MPAPRDLVTGFNYEDILRSAFFEISSEAVWFHIPEEAVYKLITSTANKHRLNLPESWDLPTWINSVHPDDRHRVSEIFSSVISDSQILLHEIEYRLMITSDVTYICDKMKFTRDENGRATLVVGVWKDITAERQRELQLKAALDVQMQLNEQIRERKHELLRKEEELQQVSDQLVASFNELYERRVVLDRSQELANIGSWEWDLTTNRLSWSEQMYAIYGVDRRLDISSFEDTFSLHASSSRTVLEEVLANIRKDVSSHFDVKLEVLTPLGYKKWVRLQSLPATSDRGTRIIGLAYDLTFYIEAEELIRTSRDKFWKAFDVSPDLMLIIRESDGVIVNANSKLEATTGYSKTELIGRHIEDVNFGIWDTAFFKDLIKANTIETSLVRKDAKTIDVLLSSSNFNVDGDNQSIIVIRDITEKKQSHRELVRNQANLRATINNTDVMIWSVDHQFQLITFNKTFDEHIFSLTGRRLQVGERITANSPDGARENIPLWEHRYKRSLSGETFRFSEQFEGLTFDLSFNPIIEDNRVIGVSVFAEDITERVAREKELINAYKTIADLRLMALRSAMNPHFVFNALNSIQYFIAKNDRLNAISFLSTFSKLIRGILNNSVNNSVRLSEELELLRYYVQLEQLRFENKFEFEMTVDDDLDLDTIEIPSLLIQPYVENAIIHGLYNKMEEGKLSIKLMQQDKNIRFEIEDNGIGREAAEQLKRQSAVKYRSFGTRITEERLNLINEGQHVSVEIIDLKEGDEPRGTRVIVWITLT